MGIGGRIRGIELKADGVTITLRFTDVNQPVNLTRHIPIKMKRRGIEMRMVIDRPGAGARAPDSMLLKTLARAHCWFGELVQGRAESIAAIAEREELNDRYVARVIRLAFLAPSIVQAIIEGTQPPNITAEMLIRRIELPLDWSDQMDLFAA